MRITTAICAITLSAVVALCGCDDSVPSNDVAPDQPQPTATVATSSDPKPASDATQTLNAAVLNALPFSNRQDFDDARRGHIADLPDGGVINSADGNPVWDLSQYAYIQQDTTAPETVNPSLWRMAQLLTISGLFKVDERIYQVRGADLSNMTIIEGDTGLIIIDPLISEETARVALQLYFAHRPERPVKAVIYTHSHVDHFGGVRGVVDEADVQAGRVEVIAPKGFTEAALAENVMAGTNMSRRASYSYGPLLPRNPQGNVTSGLGLTTSSGTVTFIAPTQVISEPVENHTIDGLAVEFMLAPGTEAPAEMLFYFSDLRAICAAEDAVHTLHNLYTLRGAKVRDAHAWAHYLNEAIRRWGDRTDVVFAQHHWPTWGQERITGFLRAQRDLYKYLHDQVLHLANQGRNMTEVGEEIELPPSLRSVWANQGYYGSVNHDAKAVYNFYLGWFDSNPANLHPLPPVEAGTKYVEYMGGADEVLRRAREDYAAGDYRFVATVLDHVVFADPNNTAAKNLLADTYEQLGYQTANGTWRNHYLTGAQELRNGVQDLPAVDTASPDIIANMPFAMLFDYLAIRLNGPRAAEHDMKINVVFTDTSTNFLLEVSNGTLHATQGEQAEDAAATISITRSALNDVVAGSKTLAQIVESDDASVTGDQAAVTTFTGLFDSFEFWFNIVTP